jgi:hypothetical protein
MVVAIVGLVGWVAMRERGVAQTESSGRPLENDRV